LKQSLKAIKNGTAEKVYLASDAADNIVDSVMDVCREMNVSQVNREHTMAQLGELVSIDVGAAVLVVLK
jgi:ribosomal protein L7Ae-like RNA K-turn-binding protein